VSDSFVPVFGWRPDPAAVAAVLAQLPRPHFSAAAPHLAGTGEKADVFAWEVEEKVLGKRLPAWDQSSIGSCVSHGWGRAVQDVLLAQVALGNVEQWPGFEVCREAIYGGSRVQVGGERGSYDDGSVGAWAAKWVKDFGVLFYTKYDGYDLTGGYDVRRCKEWGAGGCPQPLEPTARLHPVKDVTQTTTPEQVRDAVANLHFVAVCGQTSRVMKRRPGGWCPKTGNDWPHCEEIAGVCVVAGGASSPFGGGGAAPFAGDTPAFAERNSWGDYLGSDNNAVKLASGREVQLPDGVYLSTFEERAADFREGDTFAASAFVGFPAQRLEWWV